jgi:hypothetical protein
VLKGTSEFEQLGYEIQIGALPKEVRIPLPFLEWPIFNFLVQCPPRRVLHQAST